MAYLKKKLKKVSSFTRGFKKCLCQPPPPAFENSKKFWVVNIQCTIYSINYSIHNAVLYNGPHFPMYVLHIQLSIFVKLVVYLQKQHKFYFNVLWKGTYIFSIFCLEYWKLNFYFEKFSAKERILPKLEKFNKLRIFLIIF